MSYKMFSDFLAGPGYQVENPSRKSGLMDDLRQDKGGERRQLARLEDNRAAGGQGRRQLCDHLMQWVVPRCDTGRYPGRFAQHQGVADSLFKSIISEDFYITFQYRGRQPGLN